MFSSLMIRMVCLSVFDLYSCALITDKPAHPMPSYRSYRSLFACHQLIARFDSTPKVTLNNLNTKFFGSELMARSVSHALRSTNKWGFVYNLPLIWFNKFEAIIIAIIYRKNVLK